MLAGGVGAARLLRGLARTVDPNTLTVIVNTGDDEEFYGLHVSPDIDTIVYTLAGMAPLGRGWGVEGDTFACRSELDRLCGEGWFALGDRDLAMHIFRSERLGKGQTLSQCTRAACEAHGIGARILPMSDDPVRTIVETSAGPLAFQDYLVRRRARPRVRKVRFKGARSAAPAPGVVEAIERADLVIIAPSNPFVSIGPILSLTPVRGALRRARERVIAVSPLIRGRAVKGPLAAMMRGLGHRPGVAGIATAYAGLAGTLVVAPGDSPRGRRETHWPDFVERDILLLEPAQAATLARFLIAPSTAATRS